MRLRFALFLLLVAVIGAASSGAFAQEQASETIVSKARNVILMDGRTGDILFEKAADEPVPPASMSKLLTQAAVFELLKSGKLKEDQTFKISEDAWRRGGSPSGGSTMYAELNSEVSIANLLRGAIIQSANDACIALAEGIDGSEEAFVARLTEKAKQLGLKNTTLRNSTGLPDPQHLMSVKDLALVARHIITEYPERFALYKQESFTWNNITQANRNPLLKDYPGADGMKTGYTQEAGYGLVGTATRNNRRLILVVAGFESAQDRKDEAKALLDWGFRHYKQVDVFAAGDEVAAARVWGGTDNWVPLVTRQSLSIALTEEEKKTVEVKLSYLGPLYAPVRAQSAVGQVRVYVRGKILAELPVVTAADVVATESMWEKAWDSTLIMMFGG
jgi:serine-type D-Ala-D-Ala carboxypeptidase (penicillin-binding protein 5/6)